MNAPTKLVCTYGYMYGLHVCTHVCVFPPHSACALPVTSVRMPAHRAASHLLVIARMYFMHVCMLDAMCVCFHRTLLVRYFPVARARMLARRTSSRLLVIARIYFMHVCVLDARYVRCRRVSHARAMSARFSCSHARPPFMNARSPVARCSMWLHLCLYVVKYLHVSRRPNIYCSFSHTDVHVWSTLVGIMCRLCCRRAPPGCALFGSPITLARLIFARRPVLWSPSC